MLQSILLDKRKYTLPQAIKWIEDNNYKFLKVDWTGNYYRFRQEEPDNNRRYITIDKGKGIKFIMNY